MMLLLLLITNIFDVGDVILTTTKHLNVINIKTGLQMKARTNNPFQFMKNDVMSWIQDILMAHLPSERELSKTCCFCVCEKIVVTS